MHEAIEDGEEEEGEEEDASFAEKVEKNEDTEEAGVVHVRCLLQM